MHAAPPAATGEQLVDLVTPWRNRNDLTVRPMDGGLSNRCFLVASADERFVMRAPVRAGPVPDPATGFAAHRAAAAAGLAPEIIFADADTGILVTRWMDAGLFDARALLSPGGMQRLAGLLDRLQSLPPPPDPYRPLAAAARFWAWFRNHAQLDQMTLAWRRLYLEEAPILAADLRRDCFCHHDLVGANVLDTGERLMLLDFDWAAAGDPLMELAFIASSEALSAAGTARLLGAFGLDVSKNGPRLAGLRRLADHLGAHWYLAHSVGPRGAAHLANKGHELVRKLLRRRLHSG